MRIPGPARPFPNRYGAGAQGLTPGIFTVCRYVGRIIAGRYRAKPHWNQVTTGAARCALRTQTGLPQAPQ
jgi:hypothetical protein